MRYRMGDLVELVTETNSDLKYGLNDIVGVTLEKQMIPTIANLTQTDLDDFNIVHPKDFVYNPRTHGKKIGLGFNTTDRCLISTWNNNTFRVKPQMLDVIIPEFLYMHFLRDRWDKEACFNAWGSSTVVLLWSSFCDMKINVPPISEQRKIVHDYQVIMDRIELLRKMNGNLYGYLNVQFDRLTFAVTTFTPLSTLCAFVTDKDDFGNISEQNYLSTENLLPNKQGISGFSEAEDDLRITAFQSTDTLISNIRPYFKKIWFATVSGGCNADVLCFRAHDPKDACLVNAVLYQDKYFDYVMSGAKGTKMPRGDKDHIMQYPVPVLQQKEKAEFMALADKIQALQAINKKEIDALQRLMALSVSNISKGA